MHNSEEPADHSTTGVVRDSLQFTSMAIMALCVLALAATAHVLKPVLVPLVLAMLITGAMKPVISRIDRIGIPRPVTAVLFVGGFMVALVLALWSFSTPVSSWVNSVPSQLERADKALKTLREPVEAVAQGVNELGDAEKEASPTVSLKEEAWSEVIFTAARETVAYFFLTLILLYFVIGFGDSVAEKLCRPLGHDLFSEIAEGISSYLFRITVINAGLGVVVGIAMHLLDMPYPVIWGLLAFAMNYLPYVGAVAGIVLVGFVSSLTFDTLTWQLIPPMVYFTLTSIEANFVTPTLLGLSLPINPLVLIVWFLLCGWIWGFIGALLAVPMLVALRLTCSHFSRLTFLGNLIGEMPPDRRRFRQGKQQQHSGPRPARHEESRIPG